MSRLSFKAFFWTLFFFSSAHCLEKMDFTDLSSDEKLIALENREVIMKGFLNSNKSNEWFLTEKPNVKSCCVGKPQKKHEQVQLLGSFDPRLKNKVIVVQGIFQKGSEQNTPHHLLNSKTISKRPHRSPLSILAVIGAAALGGAFLVNRKKV